MQYRKLGKWGVKVSEVALGSWLTYGKSVEEKSSIRQIQHAIANGINFIDTANVYAYGAAEVVVGKALASVPREQVFLATKVFFPMGDGPNDRGLSRKHVTEQCHASLKRMQVDYIDLYQTHRPDPETPMVELIRTMDDLTRQGKILYWGVSEWSAAEIEEAVRTAESMNAVPPVSNQPCYNMLQRGIEKEVIPTSERLGVGQVVFSPLAQGVLTGKYKPGQPFPQDSRGANSSLNNFMLSHNLVSDEVLRQVQGIKAIADEHGITMAQLALAWVLRVKNISSVIIGATKVEQIDDNIKAAGIKLSDDALKRIEELLNATAAR